MPNTQLAGKNAVVYRASGAIGGAVARAFAETGARVFLAARTLSPLEAVATDIRNAGGTAEVAVLDAHDPAAVFLASDAAGAMAGAIANLSCGAIVD
jgi:3-oxoacyl-[acyl-carrier protein] reductase